MDLLALLESAAAMAPGFESAIIESSSFFGMSSSGGVKRTAGSTMVAEFEVVEKRIPP